MPTTTTAVTPIPFDCVLYVETCASCGGAGTVYVGACSMFVRGVDTAGRVACPWCGGRGTVTVLRQTERGRGEQDELLPLVPRAW